MSQTKIISWNTNGLRTRFKNGELQPIIDENPDIILFQETRTQYEQLDSKLTENSDYNIYCTPGETNRSAGITLFSKDKPVNIKKFINKPKDAPEGRFSNIKYPNFTIIQVYGPTGSGNKSKMDEKIEFFNEILKLANKLQDNNIIIMGDFNMAHEEIDTTITGKKAGFTDEEREFFNKLQSYGYTDTYREINPEKVTYTNWKSPKAREENTGSRFDYAFVSKSLKDKVKTSEILENITSSKNAPITLEINI
jgi:exodeoxyribonuclease-3